MQSFSDLEDELKPIMSLSDDTGDLRVLASTSFSFQPPWLSADQVRRMKKGSNQIMRYDDSVKRVERLGSLRKRKRSQMKSSSAQVAYFCLSTLSIWDLCFTVIMPHFPKTAIEEGLAMFHNG